jgi:hypothetical protein
LLTTLAVLYTIARLMLTALKQAADDPSAVRPSGEPGR